MKNGERPGLGEWAAFVRVLQEEVDALRTCEFAGPRMFALCAQWAYQPAFVEAVRSELAQYWPGGDLTREQAAVVVGYAVSSFLAASRTD